MELPKIINKKKKIIFRFRSGSYKHLRIKPKKNKNVLKKIFKNRALRNNFKKKYLIFFPLLIIFTLIVLIIFFSDYFQIKTIYIEDSFNSKQESRIRSFLINQNILFTSIEEIERITKESTTYPDNIFAKKIYPDTIEIKVTRKQPSIFYLDFQKYALLDQSFKVIELGSIPSPINFNEAQKQWLKGQLSIDSNIVQDIYIASLREDQIADFDWKKVTRQQKEQVLNNIILELEGKIDNYFKTRSEFLIKSFGNYPIVKFFEYSFLEEVRTKIDQVIIAKTVIDEISVKEEINSIRWVNDIRLEIALSNKKLMIFGGINNEDLSDQIKRYKAIKNTNDYNKYSIFDFRTEVFTVKN